MLIFFRRHSVLSVLYFVIYVLSGNVGEGTTGSWHGRGLNRACVLKRGRVVLSGIGNLVYLFLKLVFFSSSFFFTCVISGSFCG